MAIPSVLEGTQSSGSHSTYLTVSSHLASVHASFRVPNVKMMQLSAGDAKGLKGVNATWKIQQIWWDLGPGLLLIFWL